MSAYAIPVAVALFTWWFSTGLVLLLDRLSPRTHVWSQSGATVLCLAAFVALHQTAGTTTAAGAYTAFVAAILIWGWHELAFLLGIVTGPRRQACPIGAGTWQRFRLAFKALAYHEVGIAVTLLLVALVTWDAPNQVGLWTFAVLFFMRLSSKLNIFLGVPHVNEEFLPKRLDFLKSYFARRPMNGLFPISVTLSTLVGAYVFHAAFLPTAGGFEVTAFMLVGALILLGTLEHWLMILPLPDEALWCWAFKTSGEGHIGDNGQGGPLSDPLASDLWASSSGNGTSDSPRGSRGNSDLGAFDAEETVAAPPLRQRLSTVNDQ